MKIKPIVLVALTPLLLSALCLSAFADVSYTGELDPATNQPIQTTLDGGSTERIALSDTMYFDFKTYDYVYPIADALGEVHSGAADGMVLTAQTYINVSRDAPVAVYLNGGAYTGDLGAVNTAGEYVVSATVNGQTRRLFSFTLVGETTNALHRFETPEGFYIETAERDGADVYETRYRLDMEPEGAYRIEYRCVDTQQAYTLETTIDRTAPELAFDGTFDARGRVRSALRFTGLGANEGVSAFRNGEQVSVDVSDGGGTIYEPGTYTLYAFDAAGNATEYSFIILRYFNSLSIVFFLAVVTLISAVAIYLYIQRRRLKIG